MPFQHVSTKGNQKRRGRGRRERERERDGEEGRERDGREAKRGKLSFRARSPPMLCNRGGAPVSFRERGEGGREGKEREEEAKRGRGGERERAFKPPLLWHCVSRVKTLF